LAAEPIDFDVGRIKGRYIRTGVVCAPLLAGLALAGCRSAQDAASPVQKERHVTVTMIEALGPFESLLPVAPDSIVEMYRRYDPKEFYTSHQSAIGYVSRLIDSLNAFADPRLRIDTLALDHSFENFANAARTGKSIYLSTSYFFVFNDVQVLRSVIMHEFGHIFHDQLPPEAKSEVAEIWTALQTNALFYLFRDGEYSGNAWFGGHPDESPGELFSSAYNLFSNREEEIRVRLQYVDPRHYPVIERLRSLVLHPRTAVRL
jgi:hypothetical protein